ncbi:GntR family transcriptional regulator [Agrobacterium genomosp. 2]|uniref:GntR family transcriptional regulator n=1 Tax=Agrobacterium genomosp. 2 TaxID=1183409 RepID=UPI0009BAD4EC|nr:GntR family transcriptional regulator [Agrobacterium genomosp. 2]
MVHDRSSRQRSTPAPRRIILYARLDVVKPKRAKSYEVASDRASAYNLLMIDREDVLLVEDGGGRGRKGKLHAEAAQKLREMIVSGELAPGTRLREVQICSQLGVSRTPVREAFRTLAAEGMVELLPNRSVVVSELRASDVGELYVVVAALEALAGEIACRRITEAEIAEIATIHSEMLGCYERRERAAYLDLNHRIHRRIVEIAANGVLLGAWEALVPRVERARAIANLDPARWLAAVYEHSKMLSALARRDGAALAVLTREHFLNGLKFVPGHSGSAVDASQQKN